MRLSAAKGDYLYRVYDYPAAKFRKDLCWVNDETAQVGVGFATDGQEHILRVEQRERILIIPSLLWVSLDPPLEETTVRSREEKKEIA